MRTNVSLDADVKASTRSADGVGDSSGFRRTGEESAIDTAVLADDMVNLGDLGVLDQRNVRDV
ncbi:hypothetical protein [Streptomyces sp. NPDC001315]|uniref:hypothetical protein n=1 Tax=Streptomyces sp. NPDC001315 TaxID=3364562 RepID=UPI00367C884D